MNPVKNVGWFFKEMVIQSILFYWKMNWIMLQLACVSKTYNKILFVHVIPSVGLSIRQIRHCA
jgi:hypothetical protein